MSKTLEEEWEQKMDDDFDKFWIKSDCHNLERWEIKGLVEMWMITYFEALLFSERQKVIEMIRGMKKSKPTIQMNGVMFDEVLMQYIGYNNALDEVIDKLT